MHNQKRCYKLDYAVKHELISSFLLEVCQYEDPEAAHVIPAKTLWRLIRDMRLGYTAAELEAMEGWVAKDAKGNVDYYDVINELSDSAIQAIEEGIPAQVDYTINMLSRKFEDLKLSEAEAYSAALEGRAVNNAERPKIRNKLTDFLNGGDLDEDILDEPVVKPHADITKHPFHKKYGSKEEVERAPPSVLQYLKNTFEAIDIEGTGSLNSLEFFTILGTVFASSEGDGNIFAMDWDKNHDGSISWPEALEKFDMIFAEFINSRVDHWIGLYDKPTGQFFWYNLRDDHNFWMDAADQEKFKAMFHEGKLVHHSPEHVYMKPTTIPPKARQTHAKRSHYAERKSTWLHDFKRGFGHIH